jgi:hypothetical protein
MDFADDWDVVFALTGDDARVAPDARVEVDRHRPLVPGVVRLFGPERFELPAFFGFLRERRFLLVLVERRLADQRASFHASVFLRGREHRGAGRFHHRTGIEVGGLGCAQRVGVESDPVGDAPDVAPAVPQREHHGALGLAGDDRHGKRERLATNGDGDEIFVDDPQ